MRRRSFCRGCAALSVTALLAACGQAPTTASKSGGDIPKKMATLGQDKVYERLLNMPLTASEVPAGLTFDHAEGAPGGGEYGSSIGYFFKSSSMLCTFGVVASESAAKQLYDTKLGGFNDNPLATPTEPKNFGYPARMITANKTTLLSMYIGLVYFNLIGDEALAVPLATACVAHVEKVIQGA